MARWTTPHRTNLSIVHVRPARSRAGSGEVGAVSARPRGKTLCLLTREHRKDVGESNFVNLFSVIFDQCKAYAVSFS